MTGTASQVDSLSKLLHMELSHISGTRIVHEGSLPDIVDLVEILATLMKGPMPRRGGAPGAGVSTAPAAAAEGVQAAPSFQLDGLLPGENIAVPILSTLSMPTGGSDPFTLATAPFEPCFSYRFRDQAFTL